MEFDSKVRITKNSYARRKSNLALSVRRTDTRSVITNRATR
jgi:hypothetical protein